MTMDDTAKEIIIMAMGNSKEYSFDRSAYSWNTKCPSRFFELGLLEWLLNQHRSILQVTQSFFHPQDDLFSSRLYYQLT